jgi:hypothetical protein
MGSLPKEENDPFFAVVAQDEPTNKRKHDEEELGLDNITAKKAKVSSDKKDEQVENDFEIRMVNEGREENNDKRIEENDVEKFAESNKSKIRVADENIEGKNDNEKDDTTAEDYDYTIPVDDCIFPTSGGGGTVVCMGRVRRRRAGRWKVLLNNAVAAFEGKIVLYKKVSCDFSFN